MNVCELLLRMGLVASKNEARRLLTQNAVSIGPDRQKVSDPTADLAVPDGLVVRVGNRRIARVRLT